MLALSLVMLATLSAEPKLGCTSFTCSADLSPAVCEAYERRFTDRLSKTKEVAVITQRDVQQALGLERQRQLLGCSDEAASACITELAGALGVDGILTGVVTRTRSGYLVTLKVIRSQDGKQWVSASERAKSEAELQDALDLIARRFVYELNGKQPVSLFRPAMLVGAGLGVALTVTGGALVTLSRQKVALLKSDEPQTALELQQTASSGSALQTSGYLLVGVGVPVILAGVALALLDPSAEVAVVPSFGPAGAYVSLQWEWR